MNKLQVLPEETHSLQVLEPVADTAALFEAGKKAQYDAFWDAYQQNGERTDYQYAFFGENWESIFQPKYDLKPTDGYHMFWQCTVPDLEAALTDSGVVLDTSNCVRAGRLFYFYSVKGGTVIPELDLRNATSVAEMFGYADVRIIRKIILNEEGTLDTSTMFHGGCSDLEEIRFEGVIGKNLRLQWSGKLSDDSLRSILDHLKDLTGATTQTLTFHKDVGARLTEAQKAIITAKNWTLVY